MKRTNVSTLLILAIIGAAGAGLVQAALATSGRPVVNPPVTLPLALAAIGAIVVILAMPIRRMTQGPPSRNANRLSPGAVDPFYATRVVMLAKASALSGALLTGVGIGMLGYLLSRSVLPGTGALGATIGATAGAAVLLACGLVAEFMCRIPPEDDEDGDDGQKPIRVRQ